ncbi:3-hydroxyacyl-CoA dehydrogenase NAD-binding domain-containing protein [Isoalcanivorax beigongshangi]|uniref:3-hydroxyacyl-CoA dehydrogenase NAD-binding domain-containing protein n=1 Tax=Isoalcanivorax beigongshangi TaxID=3238810 RepID=A0ABV4AHY9_9GAMM
MTDSVVHYRLEGEIGVVTINYPPVNALGQGVREGLLACLAQGEADGAAKALVVMAEGRTFPAGADIREFGKPPAGPALPDVIAAYERSEKVIIAAIHGTALGGGLEVALGCDYRVALASAQVGLPEVKLGLLPGAGGTQRLPRLIGAEQALPLIVSGNPVKAPAALKLGILDAVLDGDLLQGALEFARAKVAENAPRRPLCDASVAAVSDTLFSDFEQSIAHRQRGFKAPFACIEAVKAAAELPFAQGLEKERELFLGLMASTESKAQRHVFFAEREVAKVPGLDAKTTQREVRSVGIIGAGTMGGGIAMNFLNAGIPVTLLEVKDEFLSRGVAVIRANYEATAKKGRLTSEQVEQRMALLTPSLSYDDLAQVDVVIEAVFENMDIKKSVFETLDKVCKPGAILATNTSTLDVNEIANVTQRPQDVIGLHFFSPANVMKLLEIVRGEATADDVIATTMALARRIGKVGVLVGVCHGFVGNRMLHRRQAEAMALVKQGASPQAVDKVLFDLGFPMGPFATSDLAGLDVGYRIREEIRKDDPSKAPRTWMDDLVEKGRCGQKTQAGVFDYEKGNRTPVPSADVDAIIAAYRATEGVTPRAVSEDEILERCMYVMVNEGAKILEEGIAMRALDIDVIWIYGYGFPVYRGGVMFWADTVGLDKIYARICELYQQTGEEHWRPSAYLKELVDAGRGFHH